jgi:hypothetical protein
MAEEATQRIRSATSKIELQQTSVVMSSAHEPRGSGMVGA